LPCGENGDRCLPPELGARGADAPLNPVKRSSSQHTNPLFWEAELAVTRMGCGANLMLLPGQEGAETVPRACGLLYGE
jgi:hypothetical protein